MMTAGAPTVDPRCQGQGPKSKPIVGDDEEEDLATMYMAVAEIRHASSACMDLSCTKSGFSSRSRRVKICIRRRQDFMAEIDKQDVHDREVQEENFHNCVKSQMHMRKDGKVTIAARYVQCRLQRICQQVCYQVH